MKTLYYYILFRMAFDGVPFHCYGDTVYISYHWYCRFEGDYDGLIRRCTGCKEMRLVRNEAGIPIECKYRWDEKMGMYWLYGIERKV